MQYYLVLSLTFILTMFWVFYFWRMLRRNTKRRFAFHIVFFRYGIPGLLLFIFGVTFVSYAIDLPAVLAKNPTHYEGDCKIIKEEIEDEVFAIEAEFDDSWAEFEQNQYPRIKEGNYYCEVDYYPGCSIGTNLKLYDEQGGKAVPTN